MGAMMVRSGDTWIRRVFRRIVPSSLGGRLTVTVRLLALATATVTVVATSVALTWQTGEASRSDVSADLGGFQAFLRIEQHDLSTDLSRLVASRALLEATRARDPK